MPCIYECFRYVYVPFLLGHKGDHCDAPSVNLLYENTLQLSGVAVRPEKFSFSKPHALYQPALPREKGSIQLPAVVGGLICGASDDTRAISLDWLEGEDKEPKTTPKGKNPFKSLHHHPRIPVSFDILPLHSLRLMRRILRCARSHHLGRHGDLDVLLRGRLGREAPATRDGHVGRIHLFHR